LPFVSMVLWQPVSRVIAVVQASAQLMMVWLVVVLMVLILDLQPAGDGCIGDLGLHGFCFFCSS
jgi:hypothetical protein